MLTPLEEPEPEPCEFESSPDEGCPLFPLPEIEPPAPAPAPVVAAEVEYPFVEPNVLDCAELEVTPEEDALLDEEDRTD